MTKERAAEIILSGRLWKLCEVCKGSGVVRSGTHCFNCTFYGIKMTVAAKKAHKLLGLPLPGRWSLPHT